MTCCLSLLLRNKKSKQLPVFKLRTAGVSLPTSHVTKFSDLSSQTKTCERDETYMEYNDFVYFLS